MSKFLFLNYLKLSLALKYFSNRSSSILQSIIKSSIVPLVYLDKNLPEKGIILDLGCGEGVLSNLISKIRPNCKVVGLDIDKTKISIAKKNSSSNCEFIEFDFFHLEKYKNISSIIINDVVHHIDYDNHMKLFIKIINSLRPNGVFILKEVDKDDFIDYQLTKFFDQKIYPNDKLCFRTKSDWLSLFSRLGIKNISIYKYPHLWQASRTIFSLKKSKHIDPYKQANSINLKFKNLKKNRVFITGGSGFLGNYLIDNLIQNGLDNKAVKIVCLSRSVVSQTNPNIHYIYGDLDDVSVYEPILNNVDYIFHLAAEVKLTGAKDLWRNNYNGSIKLIDAAKNKRIKRFVYASTIGAIDRNLNDNCKKPLTEKSKPNPLSTYGLTKLKVEEYLKASNINFSILRVAWGFGRGMTPDTHVRFLCNSAYLRKTISFFDYPGKVSICSASDICRAFNLISTHPKASKQIFFISDDNPISLGSIFNIYLSILGKSSKNIKFPFIFSFFIKKFRRFLPLSVQALSLNILTASSLKISKIGFEINDNRRDSFRELANDLGHYPIKVKKSISIITGAASGIGKSLAYRMHSLGHNLLLIDINSKALVKLSKNFNCEYLTLDISDPKFIKKLRNFLITRDYSIDWLINNAGIGLKGELHKMSISKVKKMINVNITALTELSHFFLNSKNKVYASSLVNIGSSAGYMPLPTMASYAASKSYVQSFTLSLIAEYPKERIFLFDPSGTNTNFQQNAGVKKNTNEKLLTPENIACSIINNIEKNKKVDTVGYSGNILYLMSRFIPRIFQNRLMFKLMKKMR